MSDESSEGLHPDIAALTSSTRLGQFISAGVAGTVVDMLVLAGLVELTAVSLEASKVVSWEASVIVIFLINERWTFRSWGKAGLWALFRRFVSSNAIRIGGFLVTFSVLIILHRWFGVWYILANFVGIGVGFLVNYCFEALYTWDVSETRG